MRVVGCLAVALLLGVGTPRGSGSFAVARADADTQMLSPRDAASFAKLQRKLGGRIGLALTPAGHGGSVQQLGSLTSGVAWSTSKVAIAMAVHARGAGSRQAGDLQRAITASDNKSAEALWSSLGVPAVAARAADAQLRAAGDVVTRYESRRLRGTAYTAFGQTDWTLANQARFTAGMPCLPVGRKVLRLMGQIVVGESWGLGTIGHDARFKGGWGPGSTPGVGGGYLDRQMGLLTFSGKTVAVTIASEPADGSHGSGTRNLSAVAQWLAKHIDVSSAPASPAC